MVHKTISEGQKGKPRGRPFPKGNKRGKFENNLLASSRSESSSEGGFIDVPEEFMDAIHESLSVNQGSTENESESVLNKLPELVMNAVDKDIKDVLGGAKEMELIECLDFKKGNSTLSIRFSKRHNRMYRIQIFLNDKLEIRPVTYTGSRTACAFWNLVKEAVRE